MNHQETIQMLEAEQLKRQNQQLDVEIEYRKVEVELLKAALEEKKQKK